VVGAVYVVVVVVVDPGPTEPQRALSEPPFTPDGTGTELAT